MARWREGERPSGVGSGRGRPRRLGPTAWGTRGRCSSRCKHRGAEQAPGKSVKPPRPASRSMRLNSSKHAHAPAAASPLKNLACRRRRLGVTCQGSSLGERRGGPPTQAKGLKDSPTIVPLSRVSLQLNTTHCRATAFARSLVVSVLPVPAGLGWRSAIGSWGGLCQGARRVAYNPHAWLAVTTGRTPFAGVAAAAWGARVLTPLVRRPCRGGSRR